MLGLNKDAAKTKALSTKSKKKSEWALIPFGAIFVVVGLGLVYGLTIKPILEWQRAQQWTPVPCTILSSEVVTSRSSDSTTYRVSIHFSYTFEGVAYTSKRYDFVSGSSSGRSAKQRVVDQHPPGSEHTCYVDPANPSQAILNRDFNNAYLIGLVGLLFFFVGLFVMGMGVVNVRKARPSPFLAADSDAFAPSPLPLQLAPAQSAFSKFFTILLFALFWNGIVWGIGYVMYQDRHTDAPTPVLFLFGLIFGLVGLVLIVFTFKEFLALFNPRPLLTLTPGGLQLGQSARIDWHFTGTTSRIARMRIWLEGHESATYRRGTKTRTDTSIFERFLIMDSDNPQDMASGRVQFAMPEYTMHSFTADNNKIVWQIMVHGDIKRWPDIDFSFPVEVYPLPLKEKW